MLVCKALMVWAMIEHEVMLESSGVCAGSIPLPENPNWVMLATLFFNCFSWIALTNLKRGKSDEYIFGIFRIICHSNFKASSKWTYICFKVQIMYVEYCGMPMIVTRATLWSTHCLHHHPHKPSYDVDWDGNTEFIKGNGQRGRIKVISIDIRWTVPLMYICLLSAHVSSHE